jgi:hypothetical protein
MMLNDHGKLAVILLVIAGSFACIITGTGDPTPPWAAITGALGYITGNGVLAARKQTPSAMIQAKDTTLSLVSTAPPALTNEEWAKRAVAWLTSHGATFAAADLAVSLYLAGNALGPWAQDQIASALASPIGAPPSLPTTKHQPEA